MFLIENSIKHQCCCLLTWHQPCGEKPVPWSRRAVCTGAGGDATNGEERWRSSGASVPQGKRGGKRSIPNIFSKSSPCLVSFLLHHLGKAMGQIWVHKCHVPIWFLGVSYKWLHSLESFSWELCIDSDFQKGLHGFCCFLRSFIYRQTLLGILKVMPQKLQVHKFLPCVSLLVCELAN